MKNLIRTIVSILLFSVFINASVPAFAITDWKEDFKLDVARESLPTAFSDISEGDSRKILEDSDRDPRQEYDGISLIFNPNHSKRYLQVTEVNYKDGFRILNLKFKNTSILEIKNLDGLLDGFLSIYLNEGDFDNKKIIDLIKESKIALDNRRVFSKTIVSNNQIESVELKARSKSSNKGYYNIDISMKLNPNSIKNIDTLVDKYVKTFGNISYLFSTKSRIDKDNNLAIFEETWFLNDKEPYKNVWIKVKGEDLKDNLKGILNRLPKALKGDIEEFKDKVDLEDIFKEDKVEHYSDKAYFGVFKSQSYVILEYNLDKNDRVIEFKKRTN